MTHQDSVEYLRNQNFRSEMFRSYVQTKVYNFIQEMQKKNAEKWFKENVEMKDYWNTRKKYNEILGGNLQEGVKKIVLEMFERKYGKPLQ